MNPTEYKISVMQAHLEGDPIEMRWTTSMAAGPWVKCSTPSWSWSTHEYRIATPIDPYAELKAAHAAGKVIQYFDKFTVGSKWEDLPVDFQTFECLLDVKCYRIKPDPVKSPLTHTDILPGTWVRINRAGTSMIVEIWDQACRLGGGRYITYHQLMVEGYEQSTDLKTWSPCFIENDK